MRGSFETRGGLSWNLDIMNARFVASPPLHLTHDLHMDSWRCHAAMGWRTA
jgi:hypothetical protein